MKNKKLIDPAPMDPYEKSDLLNMGLALLCLLAIVLFAFLVGFFVFFLLLPAIGSAMLYIDLPENFPAVGFWMVIGLPVVCIDLSVTLVYLLTVRKVGQKLRAWYDWRCSTRLQRIAEKEEKKNAKKH